MPGKKTKPKLSNAEQVNEYMTKLDHPLKQETEALRKIIKGSNNDKLI